MKPYRLISLLMFSTISLNACSPNEDSVINEPALALSTTLVTRETLPVNYTVVGNIVSDHRVEISSRIVGYIHSIEVAEGALIQRGQVLVTLDDSDVSTAIAQARSALNSAKAQFVDAESDLNRYQALLEDDSVSEAQVRKIRLLRDTAKNQLSSAGAALNSALSQRQYTTITSPVDGLVVTRHGRDGDLARPGIPILLVESQDGLLFQTYLPEQHLNLLEIGNEVVVKLDSLCTSIKGEILRLVPSADPVTRRFKVDISFPNESTAKNTLIPGMFGRADFLFGTIIRPVIPTDSLLERGGLKGVFVLDSDNRAHFRWLRLGRKLTSKMEVISGLEGGERILSVAQPGLSEGSLIKISQSKKEQPQDSLQVEK